MNVAEWFTLALLVAGAFFFFAGTVGLLRFPDAHCRLHAITKADNLGLGLVVAGLALQADSLFAVAKLLLIWLLALLASATSSQLIARTALRGREAVQVNGPDG
jgi:multicomponent Na+:H+ antiporter subunit G